MALTVGEERLTSSYIGSVCVVLSALFVSSLIFALLLIKMIAITVIETTTLMIKAVARELIDTVHVVYPEINTLSLG